MLYQRPLRSDELVHHGVKGQQWGVRNGPPYPLDSSISTGHKLKSNDILTMADRIYNNAARKEPKITKDVKAAAESSGARMYGLSHRLKTKESIERKIKSDALEEGISQQAAAKGIKDALRYTTVADNDNFVRTYNDTKDRLTNHGYSEVKCKNFWDLYRQGKAKHKQITCQFADINGYVFEIQFQTPDSIAAKEKKTPIYEERRKTGNTPERNAELERQMVELMETIPDPKDIYKIKSHS